jgi:hypothetical protein
MIRVPLRQAEAASFHIDLRRHFRHKDARLGDAGNL